ncbi:MAG: hypothetical protein HYX81_04630 [Chloroflexi bacterium]|nr:hypothetical protein [Chloroflexota bacterium]
MVDMLNKARESLTGNKNLLSLSIEGMSLKILACRGERVSYWAVTPLNPQLLRRGFAADSKSLANVIKAAMNKSEFRGYRRVIASIPAFHSVCRIMELPNLPGMRPEAVIPQQARRDIGYSPENTVLFWRPLEKKGSRFFIASAPKEPIITLVETLKLAGLRPDKIEITTFALSRAVNRTEALILDVEPNSLDSIIVRDNMPLVTQSTFWGETPQNPQSLPGLVSDALERIMTFYNDGNPNNPLPSDMPVFLLGSALHLNPDIVSSVESALGRSLAEFEPPLVYEKDFPKADLAVNIGLVLKEL